MMKFFFFEIEREEGTRDQEADECAVMAKECNTLFPLQQHFVVVVVDFIIQTINSFGDIFCV